MSSANKVNISLLFVLPLGYLNVLEQSILFFTNNENIVAAPVSTSSANKVNTSLLFVLPLGYMNVFRTVNTILY
jgi:hypothetical protein